MRTNDAIDAHRDYQIRLCEALGLDPGVTTGVTINEAEHRVEWETVAPGDLNGYGWTRLEMGRPPVVGLTPGNQITEQAWQAVLQIRDGWLAQFPDFDPAWRV